MSEVLDAGAPLPAGSPLAGYKEGDKVRADGRTINVQTGMNFVVDSKPAAMRVDLLLRLFK